MNPAKSKVNKNTLRWSDQHYSIDRLLVDYRLPVIVKVTHGSTGPNCYDNVANGQVGYLMDLIQSNYALLVHT
jgi:hypothetical protein